MSDLALAITLSIIIFEVMIKLLLTSSGISNKSIRDALEQLLGKPITESSALFVPTGVYPFVGGPNYAWWPIAGKMHAALVGQGWKTMGLLELIALNSIDKDVWLSSVQETDALLVWGGDPLYLAYWFKQSGLADVLPSLSKDLVYVGVSAGSMATSTTFGETYSEPRRGSGTPLSSEKITMVTAEGSISRTLEMAAGIGLVDFAIIPHFENTNHPDACGANAEQWAAKLPVPVYAIDEQSAIKVVNGQAEVISEGHWKLFNSRRPK
ncbi:Type 1 glutamine amidotransferase-like domain-containing protein [Mucilaginibacter sp. X4EP1]|uniref:Type 1 glutamine amidotransferase-like domain-containing protein n=1 Tax=Mucilaginibacter sp. X4EP1 TaxID=2723092 RepID=UPI002169C99F|nr:Type 1 glutamine amidotransferase-like domain-containing protein [Mucilaginibacter sp. X4EP1]MCS3815980.1 dipeptidase E [Mucilaginibacter sp. X4EP1]